MTGDEHAVQSIRDALPAVTASVYLNTGTAGPIPLPASRAMAEAAERELRVGRASPLEFPELAKALGALRHQLAAFVGASPDEIAVTHNTSEGINIVAWGLRWDSRDEVVTTSVEHPGGLLPLFQLHHRLGVTVRIVDVGNGEAERVLSALRRAVGPRTRLVVLSHVSYSTGARMPLEEIVRLCHERGARVLVDGAQSVGAIDVDLHELGVDYYAFSGQKWLCGPEGTGGLYVARERLAELEPTFIGFLSIDSDRFRGTDPHGFVVAPDARRYETATVYRPGVLGLTEAVRWLSGWSRSLIFQRIRDLTDYCLEAVRSLPGVSVRTPPDQKAGLVNFVIDGIDPAACVKALARQGIVIRHIPDNGCLRISCGFFNTPDEIGAAVDAIGRFARGDAVTDERQTPAPPPGPAGRPAGAAPAG